MGSGETEESCAVSAGNMWQMESCSRAPGLPRSTHLCEPDWRAGLLAGARTTWFTQCQASESPGLALAPPHFHSSLPDSEGCRVGAGHVHSP